MHRRDLIKAALSGQLAAAANRPAGAAQAAPRGNAPRRPNILWVCSDQQRYDTIEGLNNTYTRTPNLRRFMGQSTAFTHAFVQNPVCSPSRASFLTGRYPHTTGLRANGQGIRESERLVPRILADYGYECGLAGKLHLSPCAGGRVEQRIDDGYHRFWWSHDMQDIWPGRNAWREWLRAQGVKWPDPPASPTWGVPLDTRYSHTAWCCDRAIQFLREQRAFGPWLMSLNLFQPHHPFWPSQEFLRRYDPEKLPPPAYREGELENKPMYQKRDHQGAYGGGGLSFAKTDDRTHRQITAAYYAMIEEVDHHFGRVLAALEQSGQAENTIVVYMSDHGEMMGDHGIYWKGPYFYDCAMRVPLMIRWPGRFKAGQRLDALVEMVDVAPTLLEAAGIGIPAAMQGRSLAPLLEGRATEHRESVYMENYDPSGHGRMPVMATAIRTRRHKLAVYHSLDTGELYDLEADPGEHRNLWSSPGHHDVREQLSVKLMARMAETADPLPQKNAPW